MDFFYAPYLVKYIENRFGELQVIIMPSRYTPSTRKPKVNPSSSNQVKANIAISANKFYDLINHNFFVGDYFVDFTYAPRLSIKERRAKRKYILKSKLPKAYSKYHTDFKFIGVSGFGSKNKNFHEHILLPAILALKDTSDLYQLFNSCMVDGVTVHVEIIRTHYGEANLERINTIFSYMASHWNIELEMGDDGKQLCDIRNLDLTDHKTIAALGNIYDKAAYSFYENYLDDPTEIHERDAILDGIRSETNMFSKVESFQKLCKRRWFRGGNLIVPFSHYELDQGQMLDEFMNCYEQKEFAAFVEKNFPDYRFYREGRASSNNALSVLRNADGQNCGYVCRFTLVRKDSPVDYAKDMKPKNQERIVRYLGFFIDKHTGEVIDLDDEL